MGTGDAELSSSLPARHFVLAAIALACAWLIGVTASVANLPLLSDDHAHLATVAPFDSWRDAFDPSLVPLRPGQWWTFHALVDAADASGARWFALALLAGSAALVFRITRALGGTNAGAAAAVLLFCTFDHVTNLAWPAAIGWPGRTFGLLLGLHGYLSHLKRPGVVPAIQALLGVGIALAFHQSAVIFAAWCAAAAWSIDGRAVLQRRIRDPLTWGVALWIGAYVLYVMAFRETKGHAGSPLAALPASLLRAGTWWLPLPVRHFVDEAFRARDGWLLLAGPLAALGPAIAAYGIWRGGAGRLLALAIVADVTFSAVFAGFRPRYAPTAAALAATWVGVAAGDVRGRTRVVVAGVAGLLALTTVARIATFRDAGDLASRIVAAAESADRAAPPGATLVLVDVPGELDRDLSVPVFRYGLREALRARGIDRAIESWAVDRDRVAEPSRSASSEELRNARDDPARVVIQVHSDAGGGWRIDGGRP